MEVGEKYQKLKRSVLALAVLAGGFILSSDNPVSTNALRNEPSTEQAVPGPLAAHNTIAITHPETVPEPEATTSTSEPQATPTTEYAPTTTKSPEAPHPVELGSKKIRDKVAQSLPAKKLVALHVSPKLQSQFPTGLFVAVRGANCGAITEFTPEKGKVRVENRIFARPHDITNPRILDGPGAYNGTIGHGDTDAAAALGRMPVETVPPNIASLQKAVVALTATVCSQMPKTP